MLPLRNFALALGFCAASVQAQSFLAGHFEGGGASQGFFSIGCDQTTNLQSLPPGYDSFVITDARGTDCSASFFCGANEQLTNLDEFQDATYVFAPCREDLSISKYVALCNC